MYTCDSNVSLPKARYRRTEKKQNILFREMAPECLKRE